MSEPAGAPGSEQGEHQRVLGFSLPAGELSIGPGAKRDGPEPQRFLGFPATWLSSEDSWLDALARAIRSLRARRSSRRD